MTAEDDGEIGRHPVFVGLSMTLCVIAVILNLMVIFAVIKFGRYRASIDIFLTNLAASDILHAGVVTPLHFRNAVGYHKDFFGDNYVCKLVMFMPLLSVMGAILTIVVIAIDRYRVIVEQKYMYRRAALIAIASIWTMSILVSAPQLYEYNVYQDVYEHNSNLTYKSCGSEGIVENFETIYATLVVLFAFLVPLLILFICYMKLILYVWRHGKRFRKTQVHRVGERSAETMINQSQQKCGVNRMLSTRMVKILKLLIWITATFVILWTPYFVVFGMTEIIGIDDTSNFTEWPHAVSKTMTILSTISNPALYLAFSDNFREAVRRMKSKSKLPGTNRSGKGLARPESNKINPMKNDGFTDPPAHRTVQTKIFVVPRTQNIRKNNIIHSGNTHLSSFSF